jgi:hypothetical protein
MTIPDGSEFTWICSVCARRVPQAIDVCRCGYRREPVGAPAIEAGHIETPSTPSHRRSITITWDDLQAAVASDILSEAQAAQLWTTCGQRASHRPRFDAAHVAYYAGAVVVLAAMGWLITEAWDSLNGFGVAFIALAYAAAFWMAGENLWQKGLTTPGGLVFTMAVWMVPLGVFGLERATGFWPQDDPGAYRGYYTWVKGSWLLMETATIAAGSLAIWRRPFPFLTFPIAFALWFMSMDLTPMLFGKNEYSWDERKWVSAMFGLAMLLAAYLWDLRTHVRQNFAFWGYLFGCTAFWGGLSSMDSGSEAGKFIYFLINVALVVLSVFLRQRVFIVFGALGVLGYLGHLSYTVFEDSILFPVVLTMGGIGLIYLGVLYQRHRQAIAVVAHSQLPEGLRALIPPRARADMD